MLLKISGGLNRVVYYRDIRNSALSNEDCRRIQKRKGFHYKELVESGKINLRTGVLRLIEELASLNVEQFIVTTSGRKSLDPFLKNTLHS